MRDTGDETDPTDGSAGLRPTDGAGGDTVRADAVDERVWECAVGLDVVQEVERVGSRRIDLEHLVAAALLDPVARRLFLQADGDLATVQRSVGRPLRVGPRSIGHDLPRRPTMVVTVEALRTLTRLIDEIDGDEALSRQIRSGGWRDPRARSEARRRLLYDLLTHRDGHRPRDVLAGLDPSAWWPSHLAGKLQESLHERPHGLPPDLRPDRAARV